MIVTHIKTVRLIAAAAAVAVLQSCLMHRFSYACISFDLIALLAVFLALNTTAAGTLWWVLGLGLLRDLGSTGRMGLSAVSFLPAVLLVWALKERFDRTSPVSETSVSFLFLLGSGILYAAGTLLLCGGAASGLFCHAAGRAAFSAILAPPLFALFRFAGIIERKKTVF